NIAPRVDNYPGKFQIPGPELAMDFYKRLMEAEVELIGDEVKELIKEGDTFTLVCDGDTYYAKTVLIAVGTSERKLGLAKEDELLGHGVSYCALCDGHFFRNKDIIVVGGGNSALKEAIYLANLANHLTIIHRRNEFRGSNKLVDELKAKENVTVLTPYIPIEILSSDKVTGLVIENREDGSRKEIPTDGLFPLVGQIPNTQFVKIENVLDQWGTIPVNKNHETNVPGLFAGGDILPREIRQIYLAEHDGKISAKAIREYLNK
ncbi:MAG: FAD-dependent oxidoreductase, partial [Gammaproteobacteria bacterium]|nr:FAD-dependent oxidoreductase [Gammaproteobacteria bacterium]